MLKLTKEQISCIKELVTLKGKPDDVLKKIRTSKNIHLTTPAEEALNELAAVAQFIPTEYLQLDLSIIRGFAYYSGIVFEAYDRAGNFRALAGGGRYDNLIEIYGGEKTAAVGFGMGDKVLKLFLAEKKLLPTVSLGPEYYVAPTGETVIAKALEIATTLRKKHSVDIDLMRRKLAKQIDYASAIGAQKLIIVGEKDLKEHCVTVRDLAAGKEEKIALKKLLQ